MRTVPSSAGRICAQTAVQIWRRSGSVASAALRRASTAAGVFSYIAAVRIVKRASDVVVAASALAGDVADHDDPPSPAGKRS